MLHSSLSLGKPSTWRRELGYNALIKDTTEVTQRISNVGHKTNKDK